MKTTESNVKLLARMLPLHITFKVFDINECSKVNQIILTGLFIYCYTQNCVAMTHIYQQTLTMV